MQCRPPTRRTARAWPCTSSPPPTNSRSSADMSISRRRFLGTTAALGASAMAQTLGSLGVRSARAQAVSDYKALVCVFLFGGNDSNNLVVPIDDYAQYGAV